MIGNDLTSRSTTTIAPDVPVGLSGNGYVLTQYHVVSVELYRRNAVRERVERRD
jgi:hypothetical protein